MPASVELSGQLLKRHASWELSVPSQYSHLSEMRREECFLTFDWVNETLAVVGTFPTKEDLRWGQVPELLILNPETRDPPIRRYKFKSEVNKAVATTINGRTCIAAMCENGGVYLIDHTAEHNLPLIIGQHSHGGFALVWSPSGHLASASGPDSSKAQVFVWKVDFDTLIPKRLYEISIYDPRNLINALAWCGDLVVAGTEMGRLYVYKDGRELCRTSCHSASINNIATSPFSRNLIATVSSDGSVYLWNIGLLLESTDRRTKLVPEAILPSYGSEVNSIQFSPHIDGLLATGLDNGLVVLWDISNLGKTLRISPDKVARLETVFCHLGHIMSVTDLSWHPTRPGVLASVSEDCRIQVWTPRILAQYNTDGMEFAQSNRLEDIPVLSTEDIEPQEVNDSSQKFIKRRKNSVHKIPV